MSRGESSKGLLGCFGLRSTQLVHFATLCKVTQSEHFSHDISDSIPGKPYFCIMHSSVVFSSKRCKFLELIFWENRNVFHPHSETQIGVNILVIEFQGWKWLQRVYSPSSNDSSSSRYLKIHPPLSFFTDTASVSVVLSSTWATNS